MPDHAVITRPNNLPIQRSPILGRERELKAALALLTRDDVCLLTLTGPAGTGKTRLALELAAQLLDRFEDGVYFVPLAPIGDPNLVLPTIAEVLSIRETGSRPAAEVLEDYLRDKRLLLILDNFEQVVAAGSAVAALLASSPSLKIIAASRTALHVTEEKELPVPPLTLPDLRSLPRLEDLSLNPAVALFTGRAQDVNPGFALTRGNAPAVAEIVHRVDGLPLAIELAAARTNILSPQMMLGRLQSRMKLLVGGTHHLPAHQQTMRSTMKWSYDLLTPPEKQVFRGLSVFVSGCTLDAAETVIESAVQGPGSGNEADSHNPTPDFDPMDLLNVVGSLVDKSLLRQQEQLDGEPRFTMLELIREFGLEEAGAAGEAESLRCAHAEFFLSLAEAAESKLQGPGQEHWFSRLETEHDNLRAALTWCISSGEATLGLRLGAALWRFWYVRSHFTEGRKWLTDLLAIPGGKSNTIERARVLNGAGNLAYNQSDNDAAQTFHEESLAVATALNDPDAIAASYNNLGLIARFKGDYGKARELFEQALTLNRSQGHRTFEAINLNNLANVLHDQGEQPKARELQEESLGIFRALGNEWGIAMALGDLGKIVSSQGDYETARSLYDQSLLLQKELGDRRGVATALVNLALTSYNRGKFAAARQFYSESAEVFRELGDKRGLASSLEGLGNVTLYQGDYPTARKLYEESLAIREQVGYKRGLASARNNLGLVALRQGDYRRARTLFEESISIWRDLGDKATVTISLNNLGREAMARGDLKRAEELFNEALTMAQDAGEKWGQAYSLSGLGQVALRRGDAQAAESFLKGSLALRRELGDRWSIARSLTILGIAAVNQEKPERSAQLLGAAEALMESMSGHLEPIHRPDYERAIYTLRAQLEPAQFEAAWQKGRDMPIEQAMEFALGDS